MLFSAYFLVCLELCRSNRSCIFRCVASAAHFLFSRRDIVIAAKNKVIAGDYTGKMVSTSFGKTFIILDFNKNLYLDKYSVETYEVIDEEHNKSAAKVLGRAVVGSVFGGLGAIAGAVTTKSKGIYRIALSFADGKKSLMEVNDKIYKAFISSDF